MGMKCPTPIYIHYQCFAFPRVTWRKHLLVSHNLPLHPSSTVLSSLDHSNFSALTPKNCCIKAGVFCQTSSREGENPQRQGTNRGAKTGLAGLCAQHQVITSLVISRAWTYSCTLGPDSKQIAAAEFVKEMSVLSVEGLELIWLGMCTLGAERRTSVFSGMAPFVTILGLISICKRDNCSHMEAIDRRGQCNFFHEGGQGKKKKPLCRNLSWHKKKQKIRVWGERNSFQCSDSLIPSPSNNNHTPHQNPLQSFLLPLIGSGDMMLNSIRSSRQKIWHTSQHVRPDCIKMHHFVGKWHCIMLKLRRKQEHVNPCQHSNLFLIVF